MALYFTKKKRWPPSKPIQYILACFLLLIAIAIMSAWLIIRYHNSAAPATPTDETQVTTSDTIVETITEKAQCLIIFDFADAERFVLVQTDPGNNSITVVPLPTGLTDDEGCSLTEALRRHGAAKVTSIVSETLELSVNHYLTFTPKGVEQCLSQLDNGVLFNVPESVTYTDENGATIRLSAGEHLLSSGQVRSLLAYTKWSKSKTKNNLAADLTVAIINQYLVEGRSLIGYFGSISNGATTDLRIDNFNGYQDALVQLAQNNDGTICRRIELKGTTKKGVFTPDLDALRRETTLY